MLSLPCLDVHQANVCRHTSTLAARKRWLQVSLLLAVPHMSAPMRVQQALHFNFSANGSHAGAATSAPVDLLRNPALAKKEMVRSGVAFGARIGSNAFAFLPL